LARTKKPAAKKRSTRAGVTVTENGDEVSNRQRAVPIAIAPLREFLQQIKNDLGLASSQVTICLVSDRSIARMNKTFRKVSGPTDVLSFPAETERKPVKFIAGKVAERYETELGDVAIAPATAQRYAKRDGRPLPAELRILMLHGILHLLGYDHETDSGEMNRLEKRLRKRYGLPR
jgi:probable rRNA maturation factor